MKIEFKDNKMIITHPSGHVDELEKKDLEIFRDFLLEQRERTNKQIQKAEEDLEKL